jgi:hypothetical protein
MKNSSKKALRRLLGHRARFSYGEPVSYLMDVDNRNQLGQRGFSCIRPTNSSVLIRVNPVIPDEISFQPGDCRK